MDNHTSFARRKISPRDELSLDKTDTLLRTFIIYFFELLYMYSGV